MPILGHYIVVMMTAFLLLFEFNISWLFYYMHIYMYRRYSLSKYFSTLLKTRTKGVYIGLIYFFKHESIISAVQTFFWAPTEHSFLFFGHLLVSPSIFGVHCLKKVGGCVLGLNVQDFFPFYFNCVV